jgi:hypothetical protein
MQVDRAEQEATLQKFMTAVTSATFRDLLKC